MELVNNLVDDGVQAFVVCAGSRNFPLIEAICESKRAPIFNHFEEREAAFFALGLAKRAGKPVCVVTTSGTAVSETLPAIIEAYYSGIPLVVLSADRPVRYRNTGAPQAIEQSDLLIPFVAARYDFEVADQPAIAISKELPTHINVCFEEGENHSSPPSPSALKELFTKTHTRIEANKAVDTLLSFVNAVKRPLMIVGHIDQAIRGPVASLARRLNIPIFAESLSGLRETKDLDKLLVKSGEKILSRGAFDSVIRIGGVPTLRFWRDLEEKGLKVLSIDEKNFSGSPNGEVLFTSLPDLFASLCSVELPTFARDELFYKTDERASKELHALIYKFPKAEPALLYQLSHIVHEHDSLYLGNSLPIREWELCAARSRPHKIVFANRGANGIDGQLSTFLGSIDPMRHNWGVFGDLTTLYGLSAPWIIKQLGDISASLLVINNAGGKIFGRVASLKEKLSSPFISKTLFNEHTLSFEHFARMWGLEYLRVEEITPDLRCKGFKVIECCPDETQTAAFWGVWDKFWEEL